MARRGAVMFALMLSASALAGCAGNDPVPDEGQPIRPGSTGSGAPLTDTRVDPPRPRGTSERWHFHDYWKGDPTITLFEGNVTLNATIGGDGLPAIGALVILPNGVIVPPETGFLTINATLPTDTLGAVNFTYKPADSNDFYTPGDLVSGVAMQVNTTESNCDVPHRQLSLWKFNFTARPSVPPTGLPAREFHLVINATIGRPLFIDPPHLDWWRSGEIIPLVTNSSGELRTARTPVTNVTLPSLPGAAEPPSPAAAQTLNQTYRVPVEPGRIVPEGTKSIIAMLNWTSQVPDASLSLRFAESNFPSEGALELSADGAGMRVFILPVAQAQTDTTYSNRTTWEFRVVPDGEPAAAFDGAFTLVVWASRLQAADALAQLTG